MSNAVQNVMRYRARLKAEFATVEGFLRMAEDFSKEPDPEVHLALAKAAANAPPPEKPNIDRPRASTNGGGTT